MVVPDGEDRHRRALVVEAPDCGIRALLCMTWAASWATASNTSAAGAPSATSVATRRNAACSSALEVELPVAEGDSHRSG
jgi:hypothetical protein